jgi:DNA-binding transcriptional MerR regulator
MGSAYLLSYPFYLQEVMDIEGIKKLYYSIGEVSEITGLDQHVLRYWETEFEQLRPNKNRGGRRIYTQEDIALLQRIQRLLRDDKYTIEGARQVLARGTREASSEHVPVRRNDLQALRDFLNDLQKRI